METDPEIASANLDTADKNISGEPAKEIPQENLTGAFRTYASDIAETMRREKGSIIKIALAEQNRRDEYQKKKNPTSTKNLIVMLLGMALIIGGIMIFVYAVLLRSKPVSVTNVNPTLPTLIFSENQVQIDVTNLNRNELLTDIDNQVASKTLGDKTINNLYLSYKNGTSQNPYSSTAFFQKLGIEIPDELFQNLFPGFMLGIYNQKDNNKLFLILKTKDFNETFLALRDFEPNMLSAFLRLFKIDTSKYGKAIFSKDFETGTLFNKEARLLKDPAGQTILSYIFLDPNTVMITTSTDAVEEVIKRLNLQTIK